MPQTIFRLTFCEFLSLNLYRSGSETTEHFVDSVEHLHKMLKDLDEEDKKDNPIHQVDVLFPFPKEQVKKNRTSTVCLRIFIEKFRVFGNILFSNYKLNVLLIMISFTV